MVQLYPIIRIVNGPVILKYLGFQYGSYIEVLYYNVETIIL